MKARVRVSWLKNTSHFKMTTKTRVSLKTLKLGDINIRKHKIRVLIKNI